MRRKTYFAAISLAVMPAVTACSSPAPPPPRVSVPAPAALASTTPPAPPPVAAATPQAAGDWMDWPIISGRWVYRRDARGSLALYGAPGRDALVTLRCDSEVGRIYLSRANETGAPAGMLTLWSSAAVKTFAARAVGGNAAYIAAEILPSDSILDAAAYSRGRIAIAASGQQSIAIPVWSELPRVIEDCRG